MKSIILIVLDGLGDRPGYELKNRTPLQAAFRPNLNWIASHGINGIMHPISPGIRCGSDTSHMSLLGYDPKIYYPGRGPFEALGLGMNINPGDLAFRANFATNINGKITDRRAGRENRGNDALASAISIDMGDYKFRVKSGVEHRAALVVSGPDLSDRITDSDPHKEGLPPERIRSLDPSADRTAEVINAYLDRAREVLSNHEVNRERAKNGKLPGNELLIRSPGKVPDIPSFLEKNHMRGACVVGSPWLKGLCSLLRMDVFDVPGATGTVGSNYRGKIEKAVQLTESHDFILVNIKATDVAGHDGNYLLKREVIEEIDKGLEPLRTIGERTVLCITGDHSTPCSFRDHSGDPVPIVFYTEGVMNDGVQFFDEFSSSFGALRITSYNVMDILMQLAGRSEKFGS
ncbi:2,3-bisphosphoglycerate-independent phosphoglycerate mutase [Thermoplasma sp. Kam2015]|uniref:2,3-bisphosphoglycerate-independent phosphoglycerate mutase n=1 Tax=Thermoplasma sp. Kam2015 TaxID=2094122 RepID=UPI000D8D9FA8|nr:2,3-bisphosphoglycerate-independent phosphoglycerate mutase [Thermoplasma sp. Kam2015]PYB68697.1 2,3-bisphosphoglycerate-independent phosphoglycerate mutase [Thermoplasma sp. Kam2015]